MYSAEGLLLVLQYYRYTITQYQAGIPPELVVVAGKYRELAVSSASAPVPAAQPPLPSLLIPVLLYYRRTREGPEGLLIGLGQMT